MCTITRIVTEHLTTNSSKAAIFAWCLYDWANSAFPTVITTFIFAAYFTQKIALDVNTGTAQWGYAMTISGVVIALLSPLIGAIADLQGRRKPWIMSLSAVAIIASASLWWAVPEPSALQFTLSAVIIGTIGFEIAGVFYNAMLHDLVPKAYYGRVSGWSWGLGYLGGLCCLLVALFGLIESDFGRIAPQAEQIRACGPLVAAWFLVFSVPLFLFIKEAAAKRTLRTAIRQGTAQFKRSIKRLLQQPNLLWFLVAHMLYIDGLHTLFAFAGVYAAGTYHFDTSDIIKFGILTNITGGLGAIALAWVDDWLGPKTLILCSLIAILLCGTGIMLTHQVTNFWLLGATLSFFVGPVQASSRAFLTHIAPQDHINEVFGLFAFSGKATSFLAPWLLASLTLYFQSQRAGILVIPVFLVVGGLLLTKVK